MTEILGWIGGNYQVVLLSASGVIAGASVIIKALGPFMQKTDKDEKVVGWLGKVHKFLSAIALNPKS